jgi:hypothetical protein
LGEGLLWASVMYGEKPWDQSKSYKVINWHLLIFQSVEIKKMLVKTIVQPEKIP